MRVNYLIGFLTLYILSFSVSGQKNIGFIAGINMANISGKNTYDMETKMSINAGLLFNFKIHKKFSFEPGIIFMDKGTQDVDNSLHDLDFRYIEIPLSIKFQVIPAFAVFGGPYVSMLRSADENIAVAISKNGVLTEFYDTFSIDVTDALTAGDWGASFGMSGKLKNGMGLLVKYDWGLQNVLKKNVATDIPREFYNRVFSISFIYMR
jgi:hypothetical protein